MSTYTPIASQTLGSAASSVVFSSIPQNYTDLVIIGAVKNTANNGDEVAFQLNGDTTSSYSRTRLFGDGSSASGGRASSQTKGALAINSTARFSTVTANFQNYSNGATFKTVLSRGSDASNYVSAYVSLWRNTSPITQITLLPDSGTTFTADSTFTIYGVSAGNSSAKASGGNIVTTDGSYWYHTFTSSGIFVPNEALTCDYLVVAGGGGGGSRHAGGGGAGGYRTSIGGSALSLSANTVYQALVGAGGLGASNNTSFTNDGTAGINSVFSTITSAGGGKGGGNNDIATDGGTGASGGGGQYGGSGGSASPSGQGNAGGSGSASASSYGGGGGGGSGASASGNNGSSSAGGAGGNGTANSISGTSITYAGGGGGGVFGSGTAGTGGTGGGGAGSSTGAKGTAGTVNLGGGGGGGGSDSSPNAGGGNGGSGIIIVRYAV
jgi:hypothetical protein